MSLDGGFPVRFGEFAFVERECLVSTAAFTLEKIGWHPCSNSLVKLQEWCAESCGGVKEEGISGNAGWYADERNARLRRGKGQQFNKDWVRSLLTSGGGVQVAG